MKGKFKQISLVAAIGLLALSACNGGSSKNGEDDYDVTVTFWHTFGKNIQDSLDSIIEDFEALVLKNDGLKVHIDHQYKGGYDDILSNVQQGLPVANTPTIAVAYPDHVADYINRESYQGQYVVNLDQYINDSKVGFGKESWLGDQDGIDDFIGAYIEEGQQFVQEGTYLIPLMKSTEVMFYNKDVVEPLLDDMRQLPDTSPYHISFTGTYADYLGSISWDELMLIGEYSIAKNEDGEYLWNSNYVPSTRTAEDFYPVFYDSDSNLFITKMMQNEIPYSSVNQETNVGSIDFETGQARTDAEAMVTALKEQYDKGVLTTKGCLGEYGSNYFIDAKCLFSIGSSGGTGYQLPSGGSFDVGVCNVPADNNNPVYVCQGPSLVMLRNSGLSEEENDMRNLYAWKFMKYLTNPDVNVMLCTYGSEGYSPVRESAYYTDAYLDYLEWGEVYADTAKVVTELGNKYFTTAVFPGSATLRDQVGGIVTTVLKQGEDVTETFDAAINQTKLSMNGTSSEEE
ncbi:MAG: extracellular solute-binding protein [Coprobacillus sp.]|nr:extracellular solute-binding protein [Coprobacillus sp.]